VRWNLLQRLRSSVSKANMTSCICPDTKKENMGYAFVNMKTPELYEEFANTFHKYLFKRYQDKFQKKATVSAAACQGYRSNVERITKARSKAGLLI